MGAENSLREDKGAAYSDDMMVSIKQTAVDIFIRGLPSYLSTAIDATPPADLNAAFKEAVRIKSRIRSMNYRPMSQETTRYIMTIIAPNPFNTMYTITDRLTAGISSHRNPHL